MRAVGGGIGTRADQGRHSPTYAAGSRGRDATRWEVRPDPADAWRFGESTFGSAAPWERSHSNERADAVPPIILSHQFDRRRGTRGEDDDVVIGGRVQHL